MVIDQLLVPLQQIGDQLRVIRCRCVFIAGLKKERNSWITLMKIFCIGKIILVEYNDFQTDIGVLQFVDKEIQFGKIRRHA